MSFTIDIKKKPLSIILCVSCLLVLFCSHMPFLSADADHQATYQSRGSWTDEGLYTGQLRNYINHNHFDLLECDALLKTPLLSAWLAGPFYFFGTTLEVARASVLLCTLISLLVMISFKELSITVLLYTCTTLLLFPVFEYAHLALSEMSAVAAIIISGTYFMRYQKTENIIHLLWSSLFLSSALLFKIQFVYILPTLPISIFLCNIYQNKIGFNKHFLISTCILIAILTILYLIYYLPLQNEFNLIFTMQSGSYSTETVSCIFFKQNIELNFLSNEYIFFTLSFLAAIIISVWLLATRKIKSTLQISILIFVFVWVVLELHKLPMAYLPVRYIISTYVAMGLFTSIVFAIVFTSYGFTFFKLATGAIVFLLLFINVQQYISIYKGRTFAIKEANKYLASYNLNKSTVIGPWAPGLTWESKSISIPIWKDLLKTTTPLVTFKPSVVISEYNEEDSGEAYRNLNIDLASASDSIKQINIAYWKINIHWINKAAVR